MSEDDDAPPNNVRTLREERGWTRTRLAQLAELPVASVRRMEWGRTVRLADALKVARALGKPPEMVFAPAFQILDRHGVKSDRALDDLAWNDAAFRREMDNVGIDPHPGAWTLKVHFLGGEVRVWPIFSADLDRFWDYMEDGDRKIENPFFTFDSDVVSIAFSLSHMAHAHGLVDAIVAPDNTHEEEDVPGIEVLLAGEREWLEFGADFDEPDYEDVGADQGQLNELMTDLSQAHYGESYVGFDDEDREHAVFRVSALAAVAISQELRWGLDDGHEEKPATQAPPPPKTQRKRRAALKVVPSR